MFKVVPRRLRIEVRQNFATERSLDRRLIQKGQYLEPFLISLLNYAEPAKPKATQPIPLFNDIIEEKVRMKAALARTAFHLYPQLTNSIYGNNANITEPTFEPLSEESTHSIDREVDSTYDHCICIGKETPSLILQFE